VGGCHRRGGRRCPRRRRRPATSNDVLARLNSLPRAPVNEGDISTAGLVALAIVAVASLVGAILGGTAGMRFHRKVDRAGLGR